MADLDFLHNEVQLGLNANMDPAKSHGVVWFNKASGGIDKTMFMVDRPSLIANPTLGVVASMFEQVSKMGFSPHSLEIYTNGMHRVYGYGHSKPMFEQAH